MARFTHRETDAGPILEICMQSDGVECGLCGTDTDFGWGVPTFNGDVVSNDFPDELYRTEGGSFPVCEECYHKHRRGEVETFDHYYTHRVCGFIGGAGI